MANDRNTDRRGTFVVLAMLAWLIGAAPHLAGWALSGLPPDALVWNMTHYHVSYQEFGFLRRGLIGSLMAPVFAPLPDGGMAEYGILLGIDAGLCLALAILAARLFLPVGHAAPGQRFFAAAILIAPVGMMQLGYDAGRLDHLNFVLLAIAARAVLGGRIWLATLLMVVALLVHEAVLFYGVPVIVALALHRSTAAAATIALPALATAAALVAWGGTQADIATALPADVALAASVWTRDMLEPARGFPASHYVIATYMALLPLFLLHRHYRLNGAAPDLLLVAPVATLALFVLGVDYGRWAHCVFVSVLLVLAAAPALGRSRGADLAPLPVRLAILPWLLPLGPIGVAVLYPFLPWII
ncbi:hypothetical protein DZD18_14650 [Rhodobacteraceae bacterium W635]|uniref:hypothetical protein n=1 Tax=Nioella halotolerans TaxID=2303578 RepID=UPI000E3E6A01|nr:hypothetical protein DZD18_14650 [Rhodobacteraceae bacterium W635]